MKFLRTNRFLISVLLALGSMAAANTVALAAANGTDGEAVFAIEQADSMFIPYGSYPHRMGLQVFDRAAAETMVAAHNSVVGKIKRMAGMSYPVYVGHPDLPGSKDLDKRAYGWVEGMAAENDGMRLSVKWSEDGKRMVENCHFKFYSPFWYLAKAANGLRPKSLISVGLTNQPNIPVPALANEAAEYTKEAPEAVATEEAAEETAPVMLPVEILAALGLAEDATMEMALDAIAAMKPEEKPETPEEIPEEKPEETPMENAADAAELQRLRTLVQAAANDAVQAAVLTGRVTPAEMPAKVAEILAANDYAAAVQALRTLPAKIKTKSVTGDLGGARVQVITAANDPSAAAREERAVAVANEYEATNPAMPTGERKRIAWERAQRKHPELFKNQSPGTGGVTDRS